MAHQWLVKWQKDWGYRKYSDIQSQQIIFYKILSMVNTLFNSQVIIVFRLGGLMSYVIFCIRTHLSLFARMSLIGFSFVFCNISFANDLSSNLNSKSDSDFRLSGMWAKKKEFCWDRRNYDKQLFISVGGASDAREHEIIDSVLKHCEVKQITGDHKKKSLNLMCYRYWMDFNTNKDGVAVTAQIETLEGGDILVDSARYSKCGFNQFKRYRHVNENYFDDYDGVLSQVMPELAFFISSCDYSYLPRYEAAIKKNLFIPHKSQIRGLGKEGIVNVELDNHGNAMEIKPVLLSGIPELDESMIAAIKMSAPYEKYKSCSSFRIKYSTESKDKNDFGFPVSLNDATVPNEVRKKATYLDETCAYDNLSRSEEINDNFNLVTRYKLKNMKELFIVDAANTKCSDVGKYCAQGSGGCIKIIYEKTKNGVRKLFEDNAREVAFDKNEEYMSVRIHGSLCPKNKDPEQLCRTIINLKDGSRRREAGDLSEFPYYNPIDINIPFNAIFMSNGHNGVASSKAGCLSKPFMGEGWLFIENISKYKQSINSKIILADIRDCINPSEAKNYLIDSSDDSGSQILKITTPIQKNQNKFDKNIQSKRFDDIRRNLSKCGELISKLGSGFTYNIEECLIEGPNEIENPKILNQPLDQKW